MATKLDTEKPLFLGATIVREGTTNGQIRKAVSELDKGDGVSYADLEAHLLANFTPAKSANYNGTYIKAYVRDMVNKFGQLSHENLGLEYASTPEAAKAEKEVKAKPLTKADQTKLDVLASIRDYGQVADASDLDGTTVTPEDVANQTKKKPASVAKLVTALSEANLVRTEKEGETTYIFLTQTGYDFVNANRPATEAAEVTSDEGQTEAAVEAAEDGEA